MKKISILFIFIFFQNLYATNMHNLSLLAEQGNPSAQYKLGLFYKNNKRELGHAFLWIHKSALKGYTPAQYEFALMFHYGLGVRQNSELAQLWFTRAARRGDPRAKSILYRFYAGKKINYSTRKYHQYYSQNFRTIRQ